MSSGAEAWKEHAFEPAVCALCDTGINLNNSGRIMDPDLPVANMPDGLPVPVLLCVCFSCEREHLEELVHEE